jgi:hypothetical protein
MRSRNGTHAANPSRLLEQEPKCLARRYLETNSIVVWMVLREMVRIRKSEPLSDKP